MGSTYANTVYGWSFSSVDHQTPVPVYAAPAAVNNQEGVSRSNGAVGLMQTVPRQRPAVAAPTVSLPLGRPGLLLTVDYLPAVA
jgi:hypothetical protein